MTPAPDPRPSWRKPFGMLLLLALVAAWLVLIANQWDWIARQHVGAQLVIFATAGLVWIYPAKPLIRWMETGKFTK